MDVLLDTNIYLEDFKMRGNQFAELFTYLRRTGSRLFLPHLVREEVTARYSDRLREAQRKGRSAHEAMWRLSLSGNSRPSFNEPDLEGEVLALNERLTARSTGVQLVDVGDYSAVDIKEVVQRAVYRKPPADESGEEIRDVILWLLALGISMTSPSGLAFISGDKGFLDSERKGLHPELAADVGSVRVSLQFFRDIRAFVIDKALDQEPIDASQFYAIAPREKIDDLVMAAILGSQTRVGRVLAADFRELELERAIRYKVGHDAHFVEALLGAAQESPWRKYNIHTPPSRPSLARSAARWRDSRIGHGRALQATSWRTLRMVNLNMEFSTRTFRA